MPMFTNLDIWRSDGPLVHFALHSRWPCAHWAPSASEPPSKNGPIEAVGGVAWLKGRFLCEEASGTRPDSAPFESCCLAAEGAAPGAVPPAMAGCRSSLRSAPHIQASLGVWPDSRSLVAVTLLFLINKFREDPFCEVQSGESPNPRSELPHPT